MLADGADDNDDGGDDHDDGSDDCDGVDDDEGDSDDADDNADGDGAIVMQVTVSVRVRLFRATPDGKGRRHGRYHGCHGTW